MKIHYLGCEQSGKPYFQNTVSQTVLPGTDEKLLWWKFLLSLYFVC